MNMFITFFSSLNSHFKENLLAIHCNTHVVMNGKVIHLTVSREMHIQQCCDELVIMQYLRDPAVCH